MQFASFGLPAMKGPTPALVVLFFVVPIWSVAMWAMLMMTVGALKDERFTLFLLFTGYFVQEPYNRTFASLRLASRPSWLS